VTKKRLKIDNVERKELQWCLIEKKGGVLIEELRTEYSRKN